MNKRVIMCEPGIGAASLLALATAGYLVRTRRNPAPPTPEQIAASKVRTERREWNDAVEAKKQAKLAAKGKA